MSTAQEECAVDIGRALSRNGFHSSKVTVLSVLYLRLP